MLSSLLSVLGVYKFYEKWLWYQVKNEKKPEHIAIILDGNRRWATEQALSPWIGHHHGADKVEHLLDWCLDMDVKSITLYAFSTENFQRPTEEVEGILQVAGQKLQEILTDPRIQKHEVRVKAIGRLGLLPKNLQEIILQVEDATRNYDKHFLNIALAYGGRAEIVDATRKIAQKVEKGEMKPDSIDETMFER
jgi:tritrans,polycis-undecaprenyl-diphosphate synthase [geranylgeranyl-diphosphate specific]